MAITRIKNSTISNRTPKYNDVLAGLPFRPIIGTASDGGNGTSASVAFTGNNVANGTITYTALSSPGSFTGTGTASPITVSGLTAGTAYTFQVKAGNSLGDSAYSAASNSVTPVDPAAFVSIASATGTSSSTTITFSSIPSTYKHLQIRGIVRGDAASAGNGQMLVQFNGDSSSGSYTYHALRGDGASASATGVATGSYAGALIEGMPGDSVTANTYGAFVIDIHDYADTSKNKTVRIFGGLDRNDTSGLIRLASSVWLNTSAISSISLVQNQGWNFKTGSVISLYGIKGA